MLLTSRLLQVSLVLLAFLIFQRGPPAADGVPIVAGIPAAAVSVLLVTFCDVLVPPLLLTSHVTAIAGTSTGWHPCCCKHPAGADILAAADVSAAADVPAASGVFIVGRRPC